MTAGTNPVGAWALPYSTGVSVQDPTTYKGNLDAGLAVAQRVADAFAPQPSNPAAMTVAIDPGFIVSTGPAGLQVITEVAAQVITITAAPGSPNNRIDLLVVDEATGTATAIAGTPATSPSPPAITAGKKQIAQVSVLNTTTAIGNANITDLRAVWSTTVPGIRWAVAGGAADTITAAYTPANAALADGLILGFRASAANATTTPSFNPDGLGAKTITKKGGAALVAGDIPAQYAECLVRYNLANTRWELLNPVNPVTLPAMRILATGNLTFYCNSAGSDSTGNGSSGNPWKTPVKAYYYVQETYDLASQYTVTVNMTGDQTSVGWTFVGPLVGALGPQSFVITGTSLAPIITGPANGYTFQAQSGAQFTVTELSLSPGSSGGVILANNGNIAVTTCSFDTGAAASASLLDAAGPFSTITTGGSFTLSSNTAAVNIVAVAEDNATVFLGGAWVMNGFPTFTTFAQGDIGGVIDATGFTTSGSATGSQYSATVNGIVFSPTSTLPGSTGGSTGSGGQYAT